MKKVLLGMTALATLAACNQVQPLNPAMNPAFNAPQNIHTMAAADQGHHPDFLRKLRNPRAYQFQPDARRSICGKNDLQHVNEYDGSLGQPVEFVKKHETAVGALAKGNSKKAINNFSAATALYEKHTGPSSKSTIDAKKQLANAYLKAGDNVKYEQVMASTTQIASVPSVDKVDEIPKLDTAGK